MSRRYHSLLSREDRDGRWCIEFGDYDRPAVKAELDDHRDRGTLKRNLKIITTADDQASIEAAVANLNGGM